MTLSLTVIFGLEFSNFILENYEGNGGYIIAFVISCDHKVWSGHYYTPYDYIVCLCIVNVVYSACCYGSFYLHSALPGEHRLWLVSH